MVRPVITGLLGDAIGRVTKELRVKKVRIKKNTSPFMIVISKPYVSLLQQIVWNSYRQASPRFEDSDFYQRFSM